MEQWRKDLYLAHHGILGQKWGKRNGPPYPLDAADHSAREKKAGWRKSLDNNPKPHKKAASSDKKSDQSDTEHKGLTDKQKKALAVTATVAAVAVIGAVAVSNPKVRELALTGKNTVEAMLSTDESKWTYESLYRSNLKPGQKIDRMELKTMRDMDRENSKAQLKRITERRAFERKQAVDKYKGRIEEGTEKAREWARKQQFELELSKMQLENRLGISPDDKDPAELLNRARRSRYTTANPYWRR